MTHERRRWRGREEKPRLLLLPPLLALVIVAIFPLGYAIYIALHNINLATPHIEPSFVGLDNFRRVLTTARSINAFVNTFTYVLFAITVQLTLGLLIATLIHRTFSQRAQAWLAVLLILPMAIPKVVAALVWNVIYNPLVGPLNYLLSVVGLRPVAWLQQPGLALYSVAMVDVWQWTPFVVLILLAGLEAQPREVHEAAEIDGATGFQSFLYITLPLLKPFVTVAVLFRSLEAMRTFDYIYVLTGGGPGITTETLDLYGYQVGVAEQGAISLATAAALLLLVVTIILSTVWVRQMKWGAEP